MFLISPVRAAHVSIYLVLCNALSGLRQSTYYITQGVALGWDVAALSGIRIMSDFLGMRPEQIIKKRIPWACLQVFHLPVYTPKYF